MKLIAILFSVLLVGCSHDSSRASTTLTPGEDDVVCVFETEPNDGAREADFVTVVNSFSPPDICGRMDVDWFHMLPDQNAVVSFTLQTDQSVIPVIEVYRSDLHHTKTVVFVRRFEGVDGLLTVDDYSLPHAGYGYYFVVSGLTGMRNAPYTLSLRDNEHGVQATTYVPRFYMIEMVGDQTRETVGYEVYRE